MKNIYFVIPIILGAILLVNSFLSFANEKSSIELPSIFLRKRQNKKFMFYTQWLLGCMLLLNGVIIYELGSSLLIWQGLIFIISYLIIDSIAYLKYGSY